jgi:hypothetical protein
MEEFKKFDEILVMDEKHHLLSALTGTIPILEKVHKAISEIQLSDQVPVEIVGQFNVARNMALYCYFFYALAPEVHLKTFTVIELALKTRIRSEKPKTLAPLLKEAIKRGLISDAGFRHISNPDPSNSYCKSLLEILPMLRNSSAHGSTNLMPEFFDHLYICADFVNQLFETK